MYLQRVLKCTLSLFDDEQCYEGKKCTHSVKLNENSTGQLSNLLFQANPSEQSCRVPSRSIQRFQASRYRQYHL